MTCPNCGEPLAERGCFCKSCGAQARCLQCKEVLEPVAKACVECGTLVGKGNPATSPGSTSGELSPALSANRNIIKFHEDRNGRDFDASLTDISMQSVGTVLAEVFAQRGASRVTAPGGQHTFSKESPIIDALKGIAAPEQPEVKQDLHKPETLPANLDLANVARIFTANGETLELTDNRLKAKSAAEYYKRLTYLFLYAHELHSRPSTLRSELLSVLKSAKVYDSNCRAWLGQKKGFSVDPDDRLKLNTPAREHAIKVLSEALDPNVEDVWNPDTKTTQKRTPRKKKA